jgi:Family of unknown function (DUF6228)
MGRRAGHHCTVDDVTLGTPDGGRLIFTNPVRGDDGEIWSVVAVVDTAGLHVERKVATHYANHFDDLIAFFEDLAESWRGWKGAKTYTSLERDLAVSAVNDGGAHVRLAISLSGPTSPPRWTVTVEVSTDPGAQMLEAAEGLRDLLVSRL